MSRVYLSGAQALPFALLLFIASVVGCAPSGQVVQRGDLVGRYSAEFAQGREELEINDDGTYRETFRFEAYQDKGGTWWYRGGNYANSGTWAYVQANGRAEIVLTQAIVYPVWEPPDHRDWTLVVRKQNGDLLLDGRLEDDILILIRERRASNGE